MKGMIIMTAMLVAAGVSVSKPVERTEIQQQAIAYDRQVKSVQIENQAAVIEQTEQPDPEAQISTEKSQEIYLLAALIHAEAENQDFTGKQLVADVVLNRVSSPDFPNTIREVIYQKNQFSVVRNGRLDRAFNELTTEDIAAAVEELIDQNDYEILYFDCGRYLPWGTPAYKYGDHYFSK